MREVEAVADVPPAGADAAAHAQDVVLLEAAAGQVAAADVVLLGLAQLGSAEVKLKLHYKVTVAVCNKLLLPFL